MYNGHSHKDRKLFQDQLWLNAGQKYCRMLQREHSAILSTFIKLPFVIKIFFFLATFCVAILHWFENLLYQLLFDSLERKAVGKVIYQ